ncbi:MAG: hypothetical protein ACD_40C00108G0002 [uncultured bacterium]|nr:MAG: hypothetical protein ACD_40C00108G0002 [uncultured bacterium]
MIRLILIGCLWLVVLVIPARVEAIIFLPAVVLIPIAKIVAVIVGGMSIPALGITSLWAKWRRKSTKMVVTMSLMLIVVLVGVVVGWLKWQNPLRPWF